MNPHNLPPRPVSPRPSRRRVLRAAAALLATPALAVRAQAGAAPVLVLRHAVTEPGVGDPPGYVLDRCETQRNLSAEGRAQALALGQRLAQRGARPQALRSSRWCRCLDTARLAFGRVEPWAPLDSFFGERAGADAQTDAVRRWTLAFRGPDNAVLVTHQVNVSALLGGWVEMGETIVLRPRGDALETIGRFTTGP